MQPVANQVVAFLLLIVLGNLVGVFFDIYRVFRRVRRLKKWGTNIGDAIFWILVTSITYLFLLYYTWGEVRLYVFIAMVMGLCLYIRLFSKYVCRSFLRAHSIFSKIIKITTNIFSVPLKILTGMLLFPVRFVVSFFFVFGKGLQRTGSMAGEVYRRLVGYRHPPQEPPPEKFS